MTPPSPGTMGCLYKGRPYIVQTGGPLFYLLDPTYYIFLESLEPGLQLGSVPSHDDHHHDDQEAQECP